MADSFKVTDQTAEVGVNATANTHTSRSVLLKRNPHLRETSQTSSPAGFGGLGSRQFLQKQLMTPGSATSASSFEEGTSYDGFSDAGTPASDGNFVTKSTGTENVMRLTKPPTKRLSSPSRESLARRLVENEDSSRSGQSGDDLLPTEILSNIVVKRVPFINVESKAEALPTSMVPLSPSSTKLTRRIVSSPPQSKRRVVVRSTGADGQIHEQVRYVDADVQVVQQGDNFFSGEDETDETSTISSGRAAVARCISTPAKTLRRVAVRKTGADGQVHEEVQFMDADGNVVDSEGVTSNATSSSVTSTPTITRRMVTPSKLTRRVLRRTGADGQAHEQVQYVDVDGNIVRTEGEDVDSISSSFGAAVTRRIVTPSKTTRRVVVRKTGADGQVHEEVQYMDADGNVVQSDGSALVTTYKSDTSPLSSSRATATRRIVLPGPTLKQYIGVDSNVLPTGRKDGTAVSAEQYIDSNGQIMKNEGGTLLSTGSFSGSVSSVTSDTSISSRRIVTRRVVASPNTSPVVRRSIVHSSASSSDAEYDENVQYVESEGGDSSTNGSSSRVVTSENSPGRRVTTRRVVTPQRVVRRMVVRNGTTGSGTEAVDDLEVDAEFVQSEDNASSDESVGGSNRGYSVSDRILIPNRTRRIVSRTPSPSAESQTKVDDVATVTDAPTSEKMATTTNLGDEEKKSHIPLCDVVSRTSSTAERVDASSTNIGGDNQEPTEVRVEATVDGAATGASAFAADSISPHDEIETTEEVIAAPFVDEMATTVTKDIDGSEKDGEQPLAAGGSWNIFGKAEKKMTQADAPCSNDKEPTMLKTIVASRNEDLVNVPEAAKADASGVVADVNLRSEFKRSLRKNSKPSAVTADEFAAPLIAAPTEEASQSRGFYGVFKSDDKPKKDSDKERSVPVVSEQTREDDTITLYTESAAPATTASIANAPVSPNTEIRTSFAIREAHQELLVPHENDNERTSTLDEDKAPVVPNKSVSGEVPRPQVAMKSVHSSASPRDNDLIQIPAIDDAAGVASVVAIDALDHNEPETYSSTHLAMPETAATSVEPHAAVATTEEDELPINMPYRKAGRSVWKFWGAQKSKSPLCEDEKLNDEGQGKDEPVAAETELTDKICSPATRDQGVMADSPRAGVVEPAHSTIAVEEGLESEPLYHNTAAALENATAVDIVVVPESQQPEEREHSEREEPVKAKSERAGGLWGLLGKKDKSEQPASVMAPVRRVGWAIPGEDDKMTPDSAVVDQVESSRHGIQSDGTSTNAATSVASSGKTIRDSERRTTELIDSIEPDLELDEHYLEIASPRQSRALDDEKSWTVKPCSLAWSKLCLNRCKTSSVGTASSGNVVLDNVNGSVKAGEFLVITGPSKDESLALLSCLAGYEDAMEGNVTVNGRSWNEKINPYIGYVIREDLFYETLTVQEHLIAQAHLRMRRTHTDEMCWERVEHLIEEMGLARCRDKLIGGGISLRGITHGERKLLALATALLTNPSILLVEEPTDGLDTFSAEKIVAKLRWLALEKGLTVVVTLHHPSSHFYGLFDVLYLVADGSCVYDGKAADCVAYFSTIGYECPEYMSPMDYFMLQMVVGDQESDDEGVARVDTLKREWTQHNATTYSENAARAAAASEDVVVDEYDQNNRYYHMGCCGQLWLLWARHIRRLSRYGFVFQWHLLAALLIGVVFGLVYLQIDLKDQHGIQNFAGAFFYVVVVQMLFIAYRTFVFMPRETAIALRERQEYRGGWYNLLCWYLTKIAAELPALIILSIVLFVPVFLLIGIGHGFKVYVYMQIVMVLAGWAAVGFAFVTLGVLHHVTLALIVYIILLVLFVVFGGLLINVTDIPDWLMWLHYISPIKYSYEFMMKIFWKRVDKIDCDWTVEGCVALTGDEVLGYYSMEKRSALSDSLILLAICLSFFFLAFWFLLALANKRISGLQWRYDSDFKGSLGHRQQRVVNPIINEKKAAAESNMHDIIELKSQHSSSAAAEHSLVAGTENHYIRVETPRVGGHGICDAPGMTLGWSSLWLKAPIDKKPKSDGETQYLLSDASGSAKCGELVLITGPSDDSNVALLKSLGGLQKMVTGNVTLNGVVSAEHVAYVARDDLFYETLTVEEHLRFQAQLVVGKSSGGCGLCCGAGTGDLEVERVEMVLDELELASKRHVLIRYLSAADTKLLAVATALLVNPSILLAEEPTSGMDFYASQRVVLKLRQLARGGRTVLVTMTHPSSHLYALFDALYLLAGGAAVYHGKVREAVPYFSSLGYQCPQYMSPVDYFIHQVSTRNEDNEMRDVQAALFKEAWSTRYAELCLAESIDDSDMQEGEVFNRFRVGCCGQLSLLFRRHFLSLARYRVVFGWHSFWMIVASVMFGLIFLQLDLNDQQDIQNWAGAFFFMIILQMLVMGYRTFVSLPREMAIVEREYRNGGYYLVSWYLTKVVAELPAMLVLSVLLFVPAYLLIGIGHGFKLYFYMQLVMWLASWSAMGLASLLLGLFRRVRVALIVYVLLLVLFVVFGGLLINVDDVPDYLIWLHYISPVKYGYEALMKLFWGRIGFLACGGSDGSGSGSVTFATVGDDYSLNMSGSGSYQDNDGCIAHSGDEVLTHYSMDTSRGSRSDSFILLKLTLLYFFIGYAFLSLRWHRHKSNQQPKQLY